MNKTHNNNRPPRFGTGTLSTFEICYEFARFRLLFLHSFGQYSLQVENNINVPALVSGGRGGGGLIFSENTNNILDSNDCQISFKSFTVAAAS